MGAGDGQGGEPLASGVPEPLLTELRMSGTLWGLGRQTRREYRQVSTRRERQRVQEDERRLS